MLDINKRLADYAVLNERHKLYDERISKLERAYQRTPHWNLQRQISDLKKEKLIIKTILERNPVQQEQV